MAALPSLDAPAPVSTGKQPEIDGFEGPLDLLLGLARRQKAQAHRVSIQALAEHYLAVVEEARRFGLELAADALIMTASLACIRSRLLDPGPAKADDPKADDPTADELAGAITVRLRRLETVLEAARRCALEPPPPPDHPA